MLCVTYTRRVERQPVPDSWIWLQEAVSVYGVPYRTLHRWLSRGGLTKYRRLGDRRTYLSREELEAALRLHVVPPEGRSSE